MFAPAIGIAEDPVTGKRKRSPGRISGAFNILQEEDAPCFDFDILQGEAIKRDGTMRSC